MGVPEMSKHGSVYIPLSRELRAWVLKKAAQEGIHGRDWIIARLEELKRAEEAEPIANDAG